MINLRTYQQKGIDTLRTALRLNRSVIYVLPTGGGKTAMAAVMAGSAVAKGLRVMFLVHRRELIQQTRDAFDLAGISYGVIQSGSKLDPYARVNIGMIQTVGRRLAKLEPPDLIIIDEAHHSTAKTWARVLKWADCYTVGLTATPCRLDGKGLREHFEEIIQGPKTSELIKQGYLSDYKIYAPATVDTSGLHVRAGDFKQEELQELMDRGAIIGDCVEHYKKIADGKQAIVFATGVNHSKHLCAAFNEAGIRARHIDGAMNTLERDIQVLAFRRGDVRVLCNVDIVGEGFDLPSVEVAILQRPTKSLSLYLQQVGRALRPQTNKEFAVIIDHVGNVRRHGFPDEDREWSLDGAIRPERTPKEESKLAVWQCPLCYRVQFVTVQECECGHRREPAERERTEVDGELVEVDRGEQKKLRRTMQGQARTLEELVELGKARGYSNPYGWAQHMMNARKRKYSTH